MGRRAKVSYYPAIAAGKAMPVLQCPDWFCVGIATQAPPRQPRLPIKAASGQQIG
jgi:hypothetical protein